MTPTKKTQGKGRTALLSKLARLEAQGRHLASYADRYFRGYKAFRPRPATLNSEYVSLDPSEAEMYENVEQYRDLRQKQHAQVRTAQIQDEVHSFNLETDAYLRDLGRPPMLRASYRHSKDFWMASEASKFDMFKMSRFSYVALTPVNDFRSHWGFYQ